MDDHPTCLAGASHPDNAMELTPVEVRRNDKPALLITVRSLVFSLMSFIIGSVSVFWAGETFAVGGDLLWEDLFDAQHPDLDDAYAITARENQLFAAGGFRDPGRGTGIFGVRAHDALTGELLWEDLSNMSYLNGQARAITTWEGKVFAAGRVWKNFDDFVVRAYDAVTGELLWEDRFDGAYGPDRANAIVAQNNRVFAAGLSRNRSPLPNNDFIVRAYDAPTGTLLWQDQFDASGRDEAFAIAAQGTHVFAAGRVDNNAGNFDDFAVRAYDALTGDLLWQVQVNGPAKFDDSAFAIAAQEDRVFAAGRLNNNITGRDFIVQAYDAVTGGLLWEDQYDAARGFDEARAVVVLDNRVFAAGRVQNPGGGPADFAVRAHDAVTGQLLWQDQYDTDNGSDEAYAITAQGNQVLAAGHVYNKTTNSFDFTVRAYDAGTGQLRWEDRFNRGQGYGQARAITALENQVFAAGRSRDLAWKTADDFTVRAYEAGE